MATVIENGAGLMSIRETAAYLGCGETLVRQLIARGEIPSVRLGGLVRIPRRDLDGWLGEQVAAARKPTDATVRVIARQVARRS